VNTFTTDINRRRFKPVTAFLISLIHVAALAAVFPYFFSWAGLILFAVMTFLTSALGVSMGYHRLFTHKSFVARPWLRYLLAGLGCLSLEMGPIGWSATHRLHHRESDHEADPHSPLVSFFWAHMGWLFWGHSRLDNPRELKKLVPDLCREPVLLFMERWYFMLWIAFALLSIGAGYLIGGWQLALSLFVWGSLVRTVYVWHTTWFVNSVTHLFGYRNYNTTDDSRNLWWVALVTNGEGGHNIHHAVAGCVNYGRKWWEFDPVFVIALLCRRMGWIEQMTITEPISTGHGVVELKDRAVAASKALQSVLKDRSVRQLN